MVDLVEVAREIAEFLQKPIEEVQRELQDYTPAKLAEAWRALDRSTPAAIEAFYKHTPLYLYDLARWNATSDFQSLVFPLLREFRGKYIADFGGGIGTLAIALAQRGCRVRYIDLPSITMEFAKFRAAKAGVELEWGDDLSDLDGQLDAVLAMDVFEHIPRLPPVLEQISKALKPDGVMVCHNNWDSEGAYPMHIDYSSQFDRWCEEGSLHFAGQGRYTKVRLPWPQVMTGTCHRVMPPFYISLLSVASEQRIVHRPVEPQTTAQGREEIAEAFVDGKSEWLVFMDDDMSFPTGFVKRLLSWGKPIIGGLYFQRGSDVEPHLYRFDKVGDEFGYRKYEYKPMIAEVARWLASQSWPEFMVSGPVMLPHSPEALIEVDALGTGCLAIHRSVFEKVSRPWFSYRQGGTEDLFFCRRAKAQGFPIFADMGVVCDHAGYNHVNFLARYASEKVEV